MKANVANYLISDLTNRFPIKNNGAIDNDIIGVMVDNWSQNHYLTSDISLTLNNHKEQKNRFLM